MLDNLGHCYDSHPVLEKLHELYHVLLEHNGFGELRMDVRILKRGQKEVIIHCGRQYRFVVDVPETPSQNNKNTDTKQNLEITKEGGETTNSK